MIDQYFGWPFKEEVDPSLYEGTSWPKITIVTPSYNQGKYLEATILSILNQNYPNLEYIVVDGGSNDESVDIIKKYQDRIDYWESEKDKGQSDAIKKGFNRATGEIANWINSDDCLSKFSLYHVGKAFRDNPKLDFYGGSTLKFNDEGVLNIVNPRDTNGIEYFAFTLPSSQPSSFYKMALVKEVGNVNVERFFNMDYDLFMRLTFLGSSLFEHKILSLFRKHEDSKTSNYQTVRSKERKIVLSNFLRSYGDQKLLKAFKSLGLYSPDNASNVKISYTLDKKNLYDLFCRNLIADYLYKFINDKEYKKASQLLKIVRSLSPDVWREKPELVSLSWSIQKRKYFG